MPTDYSSLIEQVAGPAIPKAEGVVPPSAPPAPITAPEQNFDYSALIEQVAGPDPSDADKASQALRDTQGQNPDEAAKRADIAKKLGVAPIFLPKSTSEAAAMLQRQQNEQVAQESPEVAKWVQEHAHLVGDGDLARLATMQRSYSNIEYLGKAIKSGWELAKAGAAKIAQEPLPRMANLAQMASGPLAALGKLAEAALPIFRDTEDLARTAKGDTATFEKLQQQNPLAIYAKEQHAASEQTMAGISPAQKERFGALEYATTDPNKAAYLDGVKVLGDVFQSLPTTAMLALTFALTRGAGTTARMESLLAGDTAAVANLKAIEAAKKVAIWVGGISEGTVIYGQNSLAAAASVEKRTLEEIAKSPVYQEYLKAGNDPKVAQALAGREVGETVGGIAGVLSGLTAGIGGIFLGKILGSEGGSAAGTALRGGATEAAVEGVQSPQEQFTENVVVKAKVDPTQELDQGVLEAAVKGATLGGVTGATFGIAGHSQVDQATRDRDALESLANQTAENPVRGRSPDAMAEFISTMTEGTNLAEVFVDTGVLNEVFNQHGVSLNNIESTLPEVAAQLSDETNADGYVRISTAELLSRVTNPEVRKAILDNAAASLNEDGTIGMTFLETQTFAQTSQEDFKKEAEKAVARREQAKQHDKDMTEIRQLIKKEIANTGRYDAKVAAAHAIPIAEFYRTQAARFEGMTAKQLYEQYPYRAKRGEDGQLASPDISTPKREPVDRTKREFDANGNMVVKEPGGGNVRIQRHVKGRQGLDPTVYEGAFIYSFPFGNGMVDLVLNEDGKLTQTAFNPDNTQDISKGTPWVPSPDADVAKVFDLLEERARSEIGSSERAAIDAELKALVTEDVNPGGTTLKQSAPADPVSPFYSQLRKVFEKAPAKIFSSGKQVALWLQANAGKNAVKSEEIFWSGITDWLNAQDKVSREDVLAFLDQGGVKIEVKTLSENETLYSNLQLPGSRSNYREMLITLPTNMESDSFESFHFDQPNILAHVRMSDRGDVSGNKVLVVEEVQSDWGQKGREKGFGEGGVPSAPFVTDTKSWTTLAMKHVIQEAVAGGYHSVVWTTGDQQAARYEMEEDFEGEKVALEDGMRGYYDEILPQVISGIFKQLKVEGKPGDIEFLHGIAWDSELEQEVEDTTTQPGFTITPALSTKVTNEGLAFFQGANAQGVNADFSPADLMSTFYSGANLSSIIHETGHFYLEVLERLANRPDAPAGIAEDYAKIMEWFGVTPEQWAAMDITARTPFHEQFAESQELWMLEGKAPSLKMQPLFIRFQQFMLSVYKSAEQFLSQNPGAGKLNDEVRAVFSRLIASEEAIQEAEAVRGYVPLFQTAAQAGMTEDAFTAYLKEHAAATQEGVDIMQRAAMRDVKWLPPARNKIIKRIQEEAKAIREKIKAEVTSAVMSEPVNQARHFLRTGELVDPETGDVTKSEVFKLNSKALENAASAKELKGMTDPNGLNPDEVADMFGYQSSDALLYDLMQVEDAATKIEGLTDQRMLQEHGEMIDARAIEATANAAITNEARTRFLASGLRILTKSTLPISQMTKAAYIAAENAIKNIRVKDLRPEQFAAAERRANKEALASAAKDPAMAIRAQRAALLNNQLYKAARRAQDEIRKSETHLKSLVKPAAQKAMGGEHILQVNALLDRFGIRSRASLGAITGRRDLTSYIADETARLSAVAPDIPGWILSEQASPDYTTLSIGEFRELVGAVNAIEGLARRERNQYNAIRNQTFEQEKVSFLRRLREVHPKLFNANGRLKRIIPDLVSPGKGKKLGEKSLAMVMDIETILDVLEGGKFGAVHESIFGRMSSREDWKSEKMTALTDIIKPLLMQYSRAERYAFSHKDIGSAAVGFGITREKAVGVALLHGNKEGRDRLANYGWNLATQQKIIDLLEPRDIKLVNGVWSLFDNTLWPELRALNERTRGKAPPKVEAIPHTAQGGQLTGGYFKLKYSDENNVAPIQGEGAIRGFLNGETGGGRPTTAQGSSQARVEESTKEPRLDFGVFFETMNETVHDLAYREAVADTYRILADPEIQMAIKAASSLAEYEALVNRVSDVAVRPQYQSGPFEKALTIARKNTVVVLMSGIYTAMQNYLNFIPFTEHVKTGTVVKELMRMHSPLGFTAYKFAVDNSVYLRNRHLSYDRALQEDSRKLTVDEPFMPAMSTWLWAMGLTDKIVSATGWNAAYKEAMKEFRNDHDKAVAKADHVIRRTMGSGREVDISQMQEGPYRQVLNMFYSFASSQLNLLIRAHRLSKREWNTGEKIKATTRIMKAYFRVVILPAILNDLIITALRGDTGEDEPEDWAGRFARDAGLYSLSFIPGLREIGPYVWREFDDKLPSYGFKLSPIESAVVSVKKSIPSALALYNDEGDIKDTGNVIMGLGFLTGTPGILIKNAVVGADAIAEDTAGPAALLVGPPKERR